MSCKWNIICSICEKEITKNNMVKNGPYKTRKCRNCLNKIIRAYNDKRNKQKKKDRWF